MSQEENVSNVHSNSNSISTGINNNDDSPGKSAKRQPNAYALFVRETIRLPEIQALPTRDRFRECARRWNIQKETNKNTIE